MKIKIQKFEKKTLIKSTQKLELIKNKQIEYTKKIIKEFKYTEAKNKCNRVIRTKEVDQAWQDMQCRNWIPSQRYR